MCTKWIKNYKHKEYEYWNAWNIWLLHYKTGEFVCFSLRFSTLHPIWMSFKLEINVEFPELQCHFFRLISVRSFIQNDWCILSTPNWLYQVLLCSNTSGNDSSRYTDLVSPFTVAFCKFQSKFDSREHIAKNFNIASWALRSILSKWKYIPETEKITNIIGV